MVKTCLVTGATSGIGKELAYLCAKRKWNLVLVARNEERLSALKKELEVSGVSVAIISSDLSKADAATKVHDVCKKKKITVDVLINNAGIGLYGEHTNIEVEKIEEMILLNVTTLTNLCTLFGMEMKARKSGVILNIASNAAYQPIPYFASYAATKSYVLNFTEALSVELEKYGVQVTCVSPGVTATNFFEKDKIDADRVFGNRGMDPREVARFTMDALDKKKFSVMPGFQNEVLAWLPRILPRKLVAYLALLFVKGPKN